MDQEVIQASRNGNMQKVIELLNSGIDVDVQDGHGWTPLFHAATVGQREVAELLIMRGANVHHRDAGHGSTPFMHAAACSKNTKTAELLLKHKADINARNKKQQTALHLTAGWISPVGVKFLLDSGADYNVRDVHNRTPEMLADDSPKILKLINDKRRSDAQGGKHNG